MTDYFSRCRALVVVLVALVGFVGGTMQVAAQNVQEPAPEMSSPVNETDPYEDWNRKVYGFNETIDNWFLRPVAKAYRWAMPDFADRAVTNFFNNLTEVRNFANSLFQLKGESAVVAAGRFTYNTVFGLGGLIDVATAFDLPERPEDFGQTLGYWGVDSGPYLMLPFLGPSNPRDFAGFGTDLLLLPSAWDAAEEPDVYFARTLQIVDKRADLIPAESFMSGDGYTFVRNAYLQRREYLINDGKTTSDPFADEDDDLMLEDF
ncbi:VacJ family lipoprotein [Marinobacter sp. NP-4(2019)]|nr:VacJ family lipoprotein [Marinobacter sp. NP-4(2019)]